MPVEGQIEIWTLPATLTHIPKKLGFTAPFAYKSAYIVFLFFDTVSNYTFLSLEYFCNSFEYEEEQVFSL